ncbi:asparaginase [Pseudoclavibacter helvolus]|uniref:asparaginase n=1 Tax=Pseudoclavibacter helvolus TaxID=255205 RepID=UPI003C779402
MSEASTLSAADAVELAVVVRSGFIESRHIGAAVLTNPDASPRTELGDAHQPVFPRSALKLFQAQTALALGANLTDEQTAIACGSHPGSPAHVARVRELLHASGLDDRALACPAAWPRDRASRDALVRAGEPSASVYMECSGKHAAMLAACVAQGWPTEGYLSADHPVQLAVRDTIERMTRERPSAVGVDGCGAPVFAVSLVGLAAAASRLATASSASPFPLFKAAASVWRSVCSNGWLIDGHGRPNALVIAELGVLAKSGAEGVLLLAAPDGSAVAVKMLDGSSRGTTLVGLQLLVAAGAVDVARVQHLLPRLGLEVMGGGSLVGEVMVGSGVPTSL